MIDEDTFAVTLYYEWSSGKVVVFSITDGGIVIDNIYDSKNGAQYGNTRGVFIKDNVFVINNGGIIAYKNGNENSVDNISFW